MSARTLLVRVCHEQELLHDAIAHLSFRVCMVNEELLRLPLRYSLGSDEPAPLSTPSELAGAPRPSPST
jgi:hypothetical protein